MLRLPEGANSCSWHGATHFHHNVVILLYLLLVASTFLTVREINKSKKALSWIRQYNNKRLQLTLSVILLLNTNLQSQAQLKRNTVLCGYVPSEYQWNRHLLPSPKTHPLKIILCMNGSQSTHRFSLFCIWSDYRVEHWLFVSFLLQCSWQKTSFNFGMPWKAVKSSSGGLN